MTLPTKLLERAYVVFVISLSAAAFLSIFVNVNTPNLTSPVTTITWLLVYITTMLRIMENKHRIPEVLRESRPLLALIALCCISFFWSVDARSTGRTDISLVLTTFIALDLKLRYSLEEIIKIFAYTLIALCVLGVPFDLFIHIIPSNDFDPSNWHGLFSTKNDLGRVIVLTVALFLCLPVKSKLLKFLVICAAYALLYEVHSTGAIVNCTIVLAMTAACIPLRWGAKARTLTLIILPILAASAAYFAAQNFAQVTTSVGKDPSLTGRTVLWRLAYRSILQRPILGYGYMAFWSKVHPLAWRIREAANWPTAPHSHNGYIEMFLGLGLLGFLTLLATYYQMGRRAYTYAIQHRSPHGNWPILCLSFFICYQISEASLVGPNSVFWILFCHLSFDLGTVPAVQPRINARPASTASDRSFPFRAAPGV